MRLWSVIAFTSAVSAALSNVSQAERTPVHIVALLGTHNHRFCTDFKRGM